MGFNKKIGIGALDILVSFYKDFEDFNEELEKLSEKHSDKVVSKLLDAVALEKTSSGKKKFIVPDDIKEFYEKYQGIFQAIIEKRQASPNYRNGDSLIYPFLYSWYSYKGVMKKHSSFAHFYRYLQEHEDDIPKILPVVDKLKKLGIFSVSLDKDADFTREVYDAFPPYDIALLDNMETLPTYREAVAYYHSLDSKYKITRPRDENCYHDDREIILTSLVIDPETLPDSLEDDAIRKIFVDMIIESREMNQAVAQSVKLYSLEEDYKEAVSRFALGLVQFKSTDMYPSFLGALIYGQQALTALQKQREEVDRNVVETYPDVSKEGLKTLQKDFRDSILDSRTNCY